MTPTTPAERPTQRKLFYRPQDVAEMTGASASTVYRAIERGELAAYRFGKRTLVVYPRDMDAWVESMLSPISGEDREA